MNRCIGIIFCTTIIICGFADQHKSKAAAQQSISFGFSHVVLTATQSDSDQAAVKSQSSETMLSQKPKTKTIIADLLMIDGDFYVVRGERGEIRIEVTPDTKLSESFEFGDRIKALVQPDDTAISIERASPDEPVGVIAPPSAPTPVPQVKSPAKQSQQKSSSGSGKKKPSPDTPKRAPVQPKIRIIVADLLMVDGDFYVVRGDRGEIRIEVKPDTQVSERFAFGDRIKAKVRLDDSAIAIERAKPEDQIGVRAEAPIAPTATQPTQPIPQTKASPDQDEEKSKTGTSPKTRTIIADVLMVDGDFYVVRGERGEIRIEVTPETKSSERFDFGDRIKAVVLPNDRAISVERASAEESIGVTK